MLGAVFQASGIKKNKKWAERLLPNGAHSSASVASMEVTAHFCSLGQEEEKWKKTSEFRPVETVILKRLEDAVNHPKGARLPVPCAPTFLSTHGEMKAEVGVAGSW